MPGRGVIFFTVNLISDSIPFSKWEFINPSVWLDDIISDTLTSASFSSTYLPVPLDKIILACLLIGDLSAVIIMRVCLVSPQRYCLGN